MLANIHRKIIIVGLLAFAALLLPSTVSAVPDPNCVPPGPNDSATGACVHTNATVPDGPSGAPDVLWKWELPDMDSNTPGMQYTDSAAGGAQCVIDPATGSKINSPCINGQGNDQPDKNTGQFGHFHHDADPLKHPGQMVVEPNIDDKPEKRAIEIWSVLTDPVGGVQDIVSVQAIVTAPDGTKKVSALQLIKRPCDALGTETDVGSPLHAAVNTGQLSHDKLILDDCVQQHWNVFSGIFYLNNNQPPGKYEVSVIGIDGSGNTTAPPYTNQFLVRNVVAFKIDFQKVSYGDISPGTPVVVSPGNIENTGNSNACLSVAFSEMEGKVYQNVISVFDAELKGETLIFNTNVSTGPQQFITPLGPKAPQKIRFSLGPPAVLAQDLYQGTVELSVKKAGAPTCRDGKQPGACQVTTDGWKCAPSDSAFDFDLINVHVGKPDKALKVSSGTFTCQSTGESVPGAQTDHINNANPGDPLPDHEVWTGIFASKCVGPVSVALTPVDSANVLVIKQAGFSNGP